MEQLTTMEDSEERSAACPLEQFSKEDLIRLIRDYSKTWLALDGVWFQSVEQADGIEAAMFHDARAWERFTVIEAKRIKSFLRLGERPGLDGLERALALRFYANINEATFRREGGKLIYTMKKCRVQSARARKGDAIPPVQARWRGRIQRIRQDHRRPRHLPLPKLLSRCLRSRLLLQMGIQHLT